MTIRSVVAGLLVVGLAAAGSGSASGSYGHLPVQTLASVRGSVSLFGQDGRYLAWLDSPCETLTFLESATGARSVVPFGSDRSGVCLDVIALALAGDRAYWQEAGRSNETEWADLLSARLGDRRMRRIDFQSIGIDGFDALLPVVSDGAGAFAPSSPDDATRGPLWRWQGLRRSSVAESTGYRVADAAGGGRYAEATAQPLFDCAADPKWSPDGQRIVFARSGEASWPSSSAWWPKPCLGGIWIVDASGGRPERISETGMEPSWSTDGSKLVFVNADGAIVEADPSGANQRQLTIGRDPALSPDGTKLAFSRGGALYVANADGSSERQLVSSGVEPSWSPDGRIVYANPLGSTAGLAIVNADGTRNRALVDCHCGNPAWSPDGTSIAFTNAGKTILPPEIDTISPSGGPPKPVLSIADDANAFLAPAWAPDSKELAYVHSDDTIDEGDAHLERKSLNMPLTALVSTPPTVTLRRPDGLPIGRFTAAGAIDGLGVSATTLAALITVGSKTAIQIFRPRPRIVTLTARPPTNDWFKPPLATAGNTIVFNVGRRIYALDARRGTPQLIATAAATPIGLSIVGRRVAWAESTPTQSRIRALTLP